MADLRKILFLTSLLFLVHISSNAQQNLQSFNSDQVSAKSTNYSPDAMRLGLQFGSGTLIGGVGGALGGLGSIILFAPRADNSGAGFATLGTFSLGAYTSHTFLSALGIYIVADTDTFDASYGNILIGNVIGAATGIGTLALIGQASATAGLVSAFAMPIIGGMIANSLSIDKRNQSGTALLNIDDGNSQLSTPSIRTTEIGNFGSKQAATVELVNISL